MGNTGEVKKLLEGVADVNEPNDVSRIVITPRTCIRGKVVGFVCLLSCIGKKIAKSRDLGI